MDAVLSRHGDAGEKEEGIRPCDGRSDPVGQLPHVPDFWSRPLACPRIRRRSSCPEIQMDGCRPAVDSQGQDAPVFRYGILLFRVHGCQTLHSCR